MTVAMDIAGLQLGVVTLLCPIVLAFAIYFLAITGRPGPLPAKKATRCNRSKRLPKGWQVEPAVAPASVDEAEVPEDVGEEEAIKEEEPLEEEPVEEEQQEVVVKQEPPPAARPSKKGKKKQRAEVIEEPAPVEELAAHEEAAPEEAVPEEAAPEEAAAEEAEGEAAREVIAEEAAPEEAAAEEVPPEEEAPGEALVEETVAAPAEESQLETTGKKKKRKGKKPNAAFLAAQQFRMGQEAVEESTAIEDDFDAREWEILIKETDSGDWSTAGAVAKARKEKKRAESEATAAAAAEVAVAEADAPEDVVEPVAAEEEGVEEAVGEEAECDAGEETVEAEAGAAAENEEEEADAENNEQDEQEEAAATQDKEDEEEEEEEEEAVVAVAADDDWEGEVVKGEKEPESAAPEDDENAETQMDIEVPHDKRGIVIGKNKSMLQFLVEVCGLSGKITQVGGAFTVKGSGKACKMAVDAITEIIEKGYTSLQYEDFKETSFEVSAKSRPSIIGEKGSVINTIREKCNQVVIDVPQVTSRGADAKLTVTVAGSEADVDAAAQMIQQISEFGYSEATHPDMTHIRIPVDSYQKGLIIGKSGSQIRQLERDFNVQVKILDKEGQAQVSGSKVNVKKAKAQIEKVLKEAESWIAKQKAKDAEAERKREEEAAAVAAAEAEAELEQAAAAAAVVAEETAENEEGEAAAEDDDDEDGAEDAAEEAGEEAAEEEEEVAEEAAEEADDAEDGEEEDDEEEDADA